MAGAGASVRIDINGIDAIIRMQKVLAERLSPAYLEFRIMELAEQAGQILLQGTVRACVEAVYDHPIFSGLAETTPSSMYDPDAFGGNPHERTQALLDAHHLVSYGLFQFVEVDPQAPAIDNVHDGRLYVIDYAIPVHDGYTQWVYGRNTGIFHPGRFWMDVAEAEVFPVILSFIKTTFIELMEYAVNG